VYDELYEAWTKEKENADVQALPKDFYVQLALYIKKLKEERRMLDDKTTRARLLLRESKYVRRLVKELILIRYTKVLRKTIAGEHLTHEGLTQEEEEIYRNTISSVDFYRDLAKSLLGGQPFDTEFKAKPKKLILRFLQEVPSIIGSNMKPYGPFKPEDVASVPAENAKILVKQHLAVEIEMKA
jgi:DNA replication initiation complex subunit (GINS family)